MAKQYLAKPKEKAKDQATLTPTSNDRLAILMSRMEVAKDFEKNEREMWKRVSKAVELEREIEANGSSASQRIKYPLVWGAYDHYQSTLTSTPPQTVISSDDINDHAKTLYWRGIVDYQERKLKLDDVKYEFVQSFIVTGKAVYKAGRHVETQVGKEAVEHKTADGKTLKVERDVEEITVNENFVDVVDPRKVWVSPDTRYKGPILGEECPYVVEEMIKIPDYVEKTYDVELTDEEKETISIHEDVDDNTKLTDKLKNKDDLLRVRVYAYHGMWNLKSKAKDGKEASDAQADGEFYPNAEVLFTKKRILYEGPCRYAHGNKPYIYLLNHRKFFKAKAMGVLDAVLDLDQEYNEHMNRIRTYIRRLVNPKWAKLTGTKIDEAALLDPDIGLVVDESQANSFRPVDPPKLDAAIFEKATATEQLFQFLTTITYGQTALRDQGTATGQQIAEKGSDTKIGRMVRLLERAHEELLTMILQLEQEFADPDGTNLKILGSDIIEQIKNKKKLYQIQMQMFTQQQQALQSGMAGQDESGAVVSLETGVPMGMVMDEPVDEYANFMLSDDGKTVYTKYTPQEIQGAFELYIVSQSSNRNDRSVRSAQILKALELSVNDPFVQRPELWRLWFNLNGERDTDRLVQSASVNPALPAPDGTVPAGETAQPSETAQNGAVRAAANRTV